VRIIIHVPYDTLDSPHTAFFAVSISTLGDPGPMTTNVGKTTAFHELEAIEAFRPQGCEQGGEWTCRPPHS
jgi:hypothetical protein